MRDRKVRVGVRQDMRDKADEQQRKLSGAGWQNCELTIEELENHIRKGFPIAHQFTDGRRQKSHFKSAELLFADIDHGFTLEQALEHPFIKDNATFIYTTPSHSEAEHRFRIIFVLERCIFDANNYEAMYGALLNQIPSDPNVKSCTQFFYGSSNAEIYWIGKSLNDKLINKMITEGLEKRNNAVSPKVAAQLSSDINVKVKNSVILPLNVLNYGTSIHCPFGTHQDKNHSAFVKTNAQGLRGVECKACHHSAWMESPDFRDGGFGYFDLVVKKYAGQANTTFEYQGLAQVFPELEDSLARSNFHISKSEHFSLGEILPGINLIKSPKGTGKTHALVKLVETFKNPGFRKDRKLKDGRIILIGHRQSLIRESASKLGLDCYLDTIGFDTQVKYSGPKTSWGIRSTDKPQFYAICLDSLHSRIKLRNEKYDVVIIDESEQVFSHFLSDLMDHPTNNFDIISSLIKQAKYVYCLDADLDTITLSGVLSCMSKSKDDRERLSLPENPKPNKEIYCHLNTFQPPERQLDIYVSKNHLIEDLQKSIKAGKRCYVTSNNKKFIIGQYEILSKAYPDLKFKLVVSELGDDQENRAFLKNIKTEILKYDAVFSSPSIGTGIDITFPNQESKIDCVYGFFFLRINTHFDIDQQLGRVRDPGAIKVWVNPSRDRLPTDRHAILQELLNKNTVKGLSFYLDHNGPHATSGDHPMLDILTEVTMVRRRSMNNLRYNFIKYKKNNGFNVVEIKSNEKSKALGALIEKGARKLRREKAKERILAAPDLTSEETKAIREAKEQNKPLTDDQKAGSDRYWIKQFYHKELTGELIDFDNDGKTREQVRLLEVVVNPTFKPNTYENLEFEWLLNFEFKGPRIDKNTVQKAVFLREAFASAGIYDPKSFTLLPSATYGTASMTGFISYMVAHKERLAQLFGKSVNERLESSPTSQLLSLLNLIGLKQNLVKANKGGNPGGSTYQLDSQQLQLMMEIVNVRAKKTVKEEASDDLLDEEKRHSSTSGAQPFFHKITDPTGE